MSFADWLVDTCTINTISIVNDFWQTKKQEVLLYEDIKCIVFEERKEFDSDKEAVDVFNLSYNVLLQSDKTWISQWDKITINSEDYVIKSVFNVKWKGWIHHISLKIFKWA